MTEEQLDVQEHTIVDQIKLYESPFRWHVWLINEELDYNGETFDRMLYDEYNRIANLIFEE